MIAPTMAAMRVGISIPVVQSVLRQQAEQESAEQGADDAGDQSADDAVALVTGDESARR